MSQSNNNNITSIMSLIDQTEKLVDKKWIVDTEAMKKYAKSILKFTLEVNEKHCIA